MLGEVLRPSTCTSLCSASAVPMALVPLLASPAGAAAQKMRSAWRANRSSPLTARDSPLAVTQQQTTGSARQQLAKSGSTKRWKQAMSVLCCSWRADSSPGAASPARRSAGGSALMQAALPGALDWAGTGLRQLAHHTSFTLANRAALGSAFITSPVHKRHSVTPDVPKRHSLGAVLGALVNQRYPWHPV